MLKPKYGEQVYTLKVSSGIKTLVSSSGFKGFAHVTFLNKKEVF